MPATNISSIRNLHCHQRINTLIHKFRWKVAKLLPRSQRRKRRRRSLSGRMSLIFLLISCQTDLHHRCQQSSARININSMDRHHLISSCITIPVEMAVLITSHLQRPRSCRLRLHPDIYNTLERPRKPSHRMMIHCNKILRHPCSRPCPMVPL